MDQNITGCIMYRTEYHITFGRINLHGMIQNRLTYRNEPGIIDRQDIENA